MNIEAIKEIARQKFQKIEDLTEQNVLRAEYISNNKPLAVYYLDYNQTEIPDNLRQYQEKILVSDYYNHPGYLQWNYYLVFLRDDYSNDLKKRVERDDIYTRKFLFKPDEFKDFLTDEKTISPVKKDIVIEWKKKLDAVDLDEIYSNEQYTKAVGRFIEGKVMKTPTSPKSENTLENISEKVDSLRNITLKFGYRFYTQPTTYSFGKVNLISGVNGVGKTSLLEAIENIICGYALRNPQKQDTNESITCYYNSNGDQDIFTPSNYVKYRKRDREWYSNDYPRSNDLAASFNRYNFYNSDTAFKIDKSGGDTLIQYLTRIAIGPEFGRIRDRLIGFQERLTPYQNGYRDELENLKTSIDDANKTLEASKNQKQLQDYFKVLIDTCKQNLWLKSLPASFDELPIFEKDLHEALNLIYQIFRLLPTGLLKDLRGWSLELNIIELALNKIEELVSNDSVLQKEQTEIEVFQKSLNEKRFYIQQAENYFSNVESFKVNGIGEQISILKSQLEVHKNLYNSFLKLDKSTLADQSFKINSRHKKLFEEITKTQSEKSELEIRITNLKRSLSQLQNLVLKIKASGREYLTLNPSSTKCPLCESEFKASDSLSETINHAVSQIAESLEVEKLEKQLQEIQAKINNQEKEKNALTILLSIASQFYSTEEYLDNSIQNIISDFISLEKTIQSEELELHSKNNIVAKLNLEGFDESYFNKVKANLKQFFPEYIFDANGLKQLIELKIKLEIDLKSLEVRAEKNSQSIKAVSDSFENISINVFKTKVTKFEMQEKLLERKVLCNEVLANFKSLLTYFDFEEDEDISTLELRYENIQSSLSTAKDFQTRIEQIQFAEKLKISAEVKMKDLEPRIERLSRALKVIEEILSHDTEENILKEFIDSNSESIENIFSSIHTPHEFKKVKIINSEISLTRKTEDRDDPVTMISSGQRSALALSLFLTLNRQLKNGPNILLFDDPVVYTDDLNVLSFLDYLRELVIKEKKQIFFATANKKLAGLFEKKFSFLDENDFRNISLSRN
ncbi:MAG: hypothetical protein IPL31_17620 [Saprospiraceae bacterium]|nr:hypothetical protein [Saprospiraceae bacterium]